MKNIITNSRLSVNFCFVLFATVLGINSLYGYVKSPKYFINNVHLRLNSEDLASRNLSRAMHLLDQTMENQFISEDMAMARFYNPFTKKLSSERGSVWMYGSAIEAVNGILKGLEVQKEKGNSVLYDKHFNRYTILLNRLYESAAFYLGTFDLISFTQTKSWTVYAVDRVNEKGKANVTGILNVYDDQMWLIREFIEAYKLTGQKKYLDHAEYLTAYVLDGWDSSYDADGNEIGGVPWGPGYVTKHACSNGPMISPLVWLHELYKGKPDEIEHRYIDSKDNKTRKVRFDKKGDYYLSFAEKFYNWQKNNLLNDNGVYTDMMGGCDPNCDLHYETIQGVKYKKSIGLKEAVGTSFSYNSGTMLSGAVDLYNSTKNKKYLQDLKQLSDNSFRYFAKFESIIPGYYTFDTKGFNNWFNGVLMRGYMDTSPYHKASNDYLAAFQKNLDYGYDKYLYEGYLPTDLLVGWNDKESDNDVEAMFMCAYAAQYAVLSQFELSAFKR